MKHWSFNTCAIAGFAFSTVAVLLLIVNALTGNTMIAVVLPIAGVSLLIGGAFSVRAHLLRYKQTSKRML
ncbi:hypothetical protein [Leifsonia sp. A12D58]|uniref:hypothetical protein n=1 Tax=Leifsonia sp. A12D58 TaxID=3397674 RepID=UPI0039E01D71